jgi:tetratricopeptide (TPR) repeat protein
MKQENIYNSRFTIEQLVKMFCLVLLPLHLIACITGIACANSTDANSLTTSEITLSIIPSEVTSLADDQSAESVRQQLYKEEITPPQDQKEPQNKTELMQLISQIRSIKFSYDDYTPDSNAVKKEKTAVDPNTKPSGASQPKTNAEPKAEVIITSTSSSVSEQTLQKLTGLLKEPQKINNPAQLAEVLYLDGKPQQAAVLYQEALRLTKPDDASQTANRAWYLFQAANCLRASDITAASKLFEQLIKEYPDSPWTASAKVQNKIILWYQQDETDKLITANNQKAISLDKDNLTSKNSNANTDNDPNGQN